MAGWPEREIGRIAARQRALITRPQLMELGVTRAAIDHAILRVVCTAGIARREPEAIPVRIATALAPAPQPDRMPSR